MFETFLTWYKNILSHHYCAITDSKLSHKYCRFWKKSNFAPVYLRQTPVSIFCPQLEICFSISAKHMIAAACSEDAHSSEAPTEWKKNKIWLVWLSQSMCVIVSHVLRYLRSHSGFQFHWKQNYFMSKFSLDSLIENLSVAYRVSVIPSFYWTLVLYHAQQLPKHWLDYFMRPFLSTYLHKVWLIFQFVDNDYSAAFINLRLYWEISMPFRMILLGKTRASC